MEPRYIAAKKYKEWNLDLKVDFKGIFKAVAKVFAGKAGADLSTIIDGAVDGFDAIKIHVYHGVPYRAYHLIFKSIQRALLYLVEAPEHMPAIADAMPPERFQAYDAQAFQAMVDDMQDLFDKAEEKEFKIYETFLHHPEQLAILGDVRDLFEDWLQRLGLSAVQAGHIGGRLGTIFVRMLNDVWRERPAEYANIREQFKDAFPETHLHERRMYNLKLKEEWERPVFDETFGLEKIYIPLRAAYSLKRKKEEAGSRKILQVVDAESRIKGWVKKDKVSHKILVLRGGPGSGKSSLMKKLAYEFSEENRQPIFFIELQHFQLDTHAEAAIEAHFARDFSEKVFAKDANGSAKRPILIFDGLDELSQTDKTGLEIAKMLVDDLIKLVDRLDRDGWEPRIIITGRDLLIQAHERSFGEEGQVLILQPYRLKEDSREIDYRGEESLLNAPQLEQWWTTYLALKSSSLPIPAFLDDPAFKELVEQPLLNFLLALTYLRGEADFGENANINNVYYDLMARVLDRPWGKHTHLKWTIEEFLEVMEEVATSAWHTSGDVRITTMSSVRKHCERNKEVHARILALESNSDSGYMRLMAAFYFRQDGEAVLDKTFEFTHKSFGEYLVARRIVTLVRRIQKGLSNAEFYGIDQAKRDWLTICAEEEITEYIWAFLGREVAVQFQNKKEAAAEIQKTLADLFSEFINKGFEPKGLKTNLDIIRATHNAESSLLLTISAFARESGEKTKIVWRDRSHPKEVLSRILLGGGELFGQGLHAVFFPEHVDFEQINLAGADLRGADLRGAYLRGADLTGAGLTGANLTGASFTGASFTGADLRGAYLTGANLRGADLRGANLRGANLRGASLTGASLTGADLTGADLRRADLTDADLRRADLRRADLTGANLTDANLTGANLADAILKGTIIYPFQLGNEILNGPDAYSYLKSQGALYVPEPNP